MNVVRVSCAVITLSFVLAASAAAQSASLEARVTDPDRAVVVGAPVVLTHVQSGRQQTGLTRGDGTFRFTNLTPGEYRVEIAASGFSVYTQTITLAAGDRTVEAALEIAPILENVTVEGVATVPTIGRVSTPLRDQPFTVNTLTSEYLEANAINDLVTALKSVPNVNAYNQYGVYQYYTFRGFRSSVQMVDGIRNEGNRVATQLANVERIEVLKGPASVLYGGNAIGGTVSCSRSRLLSRRTSSPLPQGDGTRIAARSAPRAGWGTTTICSTVSTPGASRPPTSATTIPGS